MQRISAPVTSWSNYCNYVSLLYNLQCLFSSQVLQHPFQGCPKDARRLPHLDWTNNLTSKQGQGRYIAKYSRISFSRSRRYEIQVTVCRDMKILNTFSKESQNLSRWVTTLLKIPCKYFFLFLGMKIRVFENSSLQN